MSRVIGSPAALGRSLRFARLVEPSALDALAAISPESVTGQIFSSNGREYSVDELLELARALPERWASVEELEPQLDDRVWREGDEDAGEKISPNDIDPSSKHWKRMLKAELKYPIILSPDGEIMDGYHRLLKAKLSHKSKIKVKQFEEWPEEARIAED